MTTLPPSTVGRALTRIRELEAEVTALRERNERLAAELHAAERRARDEGERAERAERARTETAARWDDDCEDMGSGCPVCDAETWDDPTWGRWGEKKPCRHLLGLRKYMRANGLSAWSEHGESPDGWLNIACEKCSRTYEAVLSDRNAEEDPNA